jgi:hypothetical protein
VVSSNDSSVIIQNSYQSISSTPFWFGEVAVTRKGGVGIKMMWLDNSDLLLSCLLPTSLPFVLLGFQTLVSPVLFPAMLPPPPRCKNEPHPK